MNCNAVQLLIPALIRGEISGRRRILAFAHIRQCALCRDEYERVLKNFYILQKENIRPLPSSAADNLARDILAMTKEQPSQKTRSLTKWVVSAAVLLIIAFMLGQGIRWSPFQKKAANRRLNPNSLTSILQNEDWQQIFHVLSIPSERAACASEKIPIALLIDKLQILRQKGLTSVDLKWFSTSYAGNLFPPSRHLLAEQLNGLIVDNTIKTADLIQVLKQAARYKKAISLADISGILQLTSERIL